MAKDKGIQLIVVEEGNYDLKIELEKNSLGQITQGICIGSTLYQNQAMILRTQPGQIKENPLAGVGLTDIINDDNVDFWKRKITEQFEADGQVIALLNVNNAGLEVDAKYR